MQCHCRSRLLPSYTADFRDCSDYEELQGPSTPDILKRLEQAYGCVRRVRAACPHRVQIRLTCACFNVGGVGTMAWALRASAVSPRCWRSAVPFFPLLTSACAVAVSALAGVVVGGSARHALTHVSGCFPRLAHLPEATLRKYEDPKSFFSVGWSHGKEKLEGKPDYSKVPRHCAPTALLVS